MEFDLKQHIRSVLEETSEEDLHTLTYLIFKDIPKRAYGEALLQALPDQVRGALARTPRAPRADDSQPGQGPTVTHTTSSGLGNDTTGEGHTTSASQATVTLPGGQNTRNSRIAMIRRNRFRENVWIGGGTYRQILDCTIADLEFAAEESHLKAEANAARERQYRRLLKIMTERKVSKVGELTDAEIQEALSDA